MAYKGNLSYLIKKLLYIAQPEPRHVFVGFFILILSAFFFSASSHSLEEFVKLIFCSLFKNFNLDELWIKALCSVTLFISATAVYVFLAYIILREARKYKDKDYAIKKIDSLDKIKALVLFVSTPSKNESLEAFLEEIKDEQKRKTIIEDLSRKMNWIMPLKLLQTLKEQTRLKKLIAVYSDESSQYKESFETMVKTVLGEKCIIETLVTDFFDLSKIQEDLLTAIDRLLQEFSGKEILIDTTSGTVPTSIIGSALTFRRDILISYVSTKDRTVNIYDVVEVIKDH